MATEASAVPLIKSNSTSITGRPGVGGIGSAAGGVASRVLPLVSGSTVMAIHSAMGHVGYPVTTMTIAQAVDRASHAQRRAPTTRARLSVLSPGAVIALTRSAR